LRWAGSSLRLLLVFIGDDARQNLALKSIAAASQQQKLGTATLIRDSTFSSRSRVTIGAFSSKKRRAGFLLISRSPQVFA